MDIFDEIDSGVSSEKFLEIMELLNGKLEQRESNTNEDSDLDKFLQDTNYFSRLIHNNLDSEESVIKTIQLVEKIGRVARNNIRFLKSATQGIKENEIANMQKEFIKQEESHREDNERKFKREHRNPEKRRNLDRNRAPRFQRGRRD